MRIKIIIIIIYHNYDGRERPDALRARCDGDEAMLFCDALKRDGNGSLDGMLKNAIDRYVFVAWKYS